MISAWFNLYYGVGDQKVTVYTCVYVLRVFVYMCVCVLWIYYIYNANVNFFSLLESAWENKVDFVSKLSQTISLDDVITHTRTRTVSHTQKGEEFYILVSNSLKTMPSHSPPFFLLALHSLSHNDVISAYTPSHLPLPPSL